MKNIKLDILHDLFSVSRISQYYQNGDTPANVLEKYHTNIILSEAMIPSLHYLEICLRNKLDQLFCKMYGQNWLMFSPKELMISIEDLKKIEKIYSRVRRENNREPTHGDIISQMTFGFWCSFFHRKYDPIIWHRKEAISSVFPNLSRANRKRSYVEEKLMKIKIIRNRIAHHEPIWTSKTPIASVHLMCLELIEKISFEALCFLKTIDRFPEIIEKRSSSETPIRKM